MAPNHEERVRTLRIKREAFKMELAEFQSYIDNLDEKANLTELKIRLEELESEYAAFAKTQPELDGIDETGSLLKDRIGTKTLYMTYRSKAIVSIQERTQTSASAGFNSENSEATNHRGINQSHIMESNVGLPHLNLPSFDGSYEDWPGFADQFKSTVHENSRLSDSNRLAYLRSCLKGNAAKIVEPLSNSAANYPIAWNALEKRYNQPTTIVANHLRTMFELPSITRPHHNDIRDFLNTMETHYRALEVLKQPTVDSLLIYLCTSKLDKETSLRWKEQVRNTFPSLEDLFTFLHERCQVLEPVGSNPRSVGYNGAERPHVNKHFHNSTQANSKPQSSQPYFRKNREISTHPHQVFNTQATAKCAFCKEAHYTQTCEEFVKSTPIERARLVTTKGLCSNCLRNGHNIRECRASTCKVCQQRHHTMLHTDKQTPQNHIQVNSTIRDGQLGSQVLLSTAMIEILDQTGTPHKCRVLLDSCSQSHFITESFCQRLRLKRRKTNIPLSGMNGMTSYAHHSVSAVFKSLYNAYSRTATFMVVDKISQALPIEVINHKRLNVPKNIKLADPGFYTPSAVEGLLGAQVFWDLLCNGQIRLAAADVKIQKTQLGWVVTGEIPHKTYNKPITCNVTLNSLQNQIAQFWAIEEGPREQQHTEQERQCESHYVANTVRDPCSGRYTVCLPFKPNNVKLGNSYARALSRFHSLERSLQQDANKRLQYIEFMREYKQLGHMTEVHSDSASGYYLPHHAVTKTDSLTTKVRVVFDASASTSSGLSLNDTLMVGPTVQHDLFSIIIRFRLHRYVLTADISKMYRQVNLHYKDRNYHKILWRENSFDPVKVYQLNTVTYGTASAPYLAIRTLMQLAEDERGTHPRASEILSRDFYVDDVLTGAKTLDEAAHIRDELILLLKKGGFHLRQWASNEPSLIAPLKNFEQQEHMTLDLSKETKTLGLYWKPCEDILCYSTKHIEPMQKITKRNILSTIAKLFDPLGLLGPIIVKAKVIMQNLWKIQVAWDESVPLEIQTAWTTLQSQLQMIPNIQIPRKVLRNDFTTIQLHGFCDASERAYGACLYLRTVDRTGACSSQLICSKSRVAPLKTQSIPRLELCAAVLLTTLYESVVHSLMLKLDKVVFWSDSMIVLHWVRASPATLKTFIANRVSELQRISNSTQWRHVPSLSNPADILSRGTNPAELVGNDHWFTGPPWLSQSADKWPQTKLKPIEIPELQSRTVLTTTESNDMTILGKISSYNKLKRILAYCLRFTHNTRSTTKRIGSLEVDELDNAQIIILRLVQGVTFQSDLHKLRKGSQYKYKGKLAPLSPFIDTNGLLRVGGRIGQSEISYDGKHPILLPPQHHITNIIIRGIHQKHHHAGIQGTLYSVRQVFWPINGKSTVKSVIHSCTRCHRVKPVFHEHPMGNLPKNRVTFKRPFTNTGIDYCGPFFIKEKRYRNTKRIKAYAAIFVCFVTRAIHIELVGDLTTESFLAALRRFFARRGKSSDMFSDNATNFVGANHELQEIHDAVQKSIKTNELQQYILTEGITWHFIPPRAPHFGGIWEAAVRSFKNHFIRVVGNTLLTFEELTTYFSEIEAILNSRPLTPMSSDPNDLTTLTPGHFLIGDPLISAPVRDLSSIKPGRLSAWQQVQQMRQHFWSRWHKEYLNELIVRQKWHSTKPPDIKIGTLVVIKEDNIPPLHWPLGRIVNIHPGNDGVIRVATVKTSNGEYKRSVKRLAPIPIETNE